jgi:hypothetical protein
VGKRRRVQASASLMRHVQSVRWALELRDTELLWCVSGSGLEGCGGRDSTCGLVLHVGRVQHRTSWQRAPLEGGHLEEGQHRLDQQQVGLANR